MASHVVSEIFLHINCHTAGDLPMLSGEVERRAHEFIRNRCRKTQGVFFHEIGGTETHFHLALRVEPQLNIAELIGELKGACSHEVNQRLYQKALSWQRGYSVTSFGKRQLPWVVAYIQNQRAHHASGKIFPRLEVTEPGTQEKPAESGCRTDASSPPTS